MPKSVTRWENSAEPAIDPPLQDALAPYVIDRLTQVPGEVIRGPSGDVPDRQYEVHRTWNTVELAQNWIDTTTRIGATAGYTSTYTAVIE